MLKYIKNIVTAEELGNSNSSQVVLPSYLWAEIGDEFIGKAYIYNTDTEYSIGKVIDYVQLLYSGEWTYTPPYTSRIPNCDFTKSWSCVVEKVKFISDSNSGFTVINVACCGALWFTYNNGELTAYDNQGSGVMSSSTITPVKNTEYDFRIVYDGNGHSTLSYKLSSSNTWTDFFTHNYVIVDDIYNGITCGGSSNSVDIDLNNITFINDGEVLFGKRV